jgi:hypothetical protein
VTSLFVTVMDAEHLAVILATTLVLLGSSMHYTADAENRHVFLDWEVSYAVRSPLGVARRVITIDGRLPGPLLNLTTAVTLQLMFIYLQALINEPVCRAGMVSR